MKKAVISLIFLFFIADSSEGRTLSFKLRTSTHKDFSRIVMEGPESAIKKIQVNQQSQNVLVTLPVSDFSVEEEKAEIDYRRIGSNILMFSPGRFRGLKVFTLKHPFRLVIDVYKDDESRTLLSPVLPRKKPKKPVSRKIETVVIDPGHGGYENGLVNGRYSEKNISLDIAKKLDALINRGSSKSFLTRKSDRYLSQNERVSYVNGKDADIFISIHLGNHEGIVIYYPVIINNVSDEVKQYIANKGQYGRLNESLTLVKALREAVIADFDQEMVSIRPLPYGFISRVEAAAVMVELPSLKDAEYVAELKDEIANTLYKGLYIYEEIKTE